VFACCLLGLYMVSGIGVDVPFREPIALACAALVLLFAWRGWPGLARRLGRFADTERLWVYAVLLGLTLRLGVWLLSLPEVQMNDGLRYLELASRLYLGQPYILDGYAFWPPGTPLIYAAFMYLLGQHSWIAVVVNCTFFLLTGVSIRAICRFLGFSLRDAGLTVLVLAVWPALFLPASQVSKEILLVGMLPAVLALLLSGRLWAALLAGGIAGVAILTQPSLMLLPLLLGASLAAARMPLRLIASRIALLAIGAVMVIAPWSYRNYQVFGEFVPVSTNAGLVLHAGNQAAMVKPLGEVGGFSQPPSPPVPMQDDLQLSRWHKDQAIRFIMHNKLDFAKLVWNRLVITMGDDSDSAYRSLRLTNKVSDTGYRLSKALSNAFWMGIAAMLAAGCWAARKSASTHALAPIAMLAAAATLYLMAVHGMAEGGSRHHMAWSWIYALILVKAMTQYASSRGRSEARRQR
ncbi:MAG: ArnT family glycosyltransferase, partial [Methylobacter sp.]